MRTLVLMILLLGGCAANRTPATCDERGIVCPDDPCGLWVGACDGPELCYEGGRFSVYLGERPRVCDDGVPRCPDGSEAFCAFLPYQAPDEIPGCDTRPWCER